MINREIKASRVNVVNTESKGLTEMSLDDAIALAEESGMDVVLLSYNDSIPVVKIADYSKMLYDKQKKEKENKKKARLNSQNMKEIHITDVISEHDLVTKAKNADRLLKEGNKVTFVIKYRGRSEKFIHEGPEKLQNLASKLTSNYKIEKTPKIEGNRVSMIVAPSR